MCCSWIFLAATGFLDDIVMPPLTGEELHKMKTRQPELWTRSELGGASSGCS